MRRSEIARWLGLRRGIALWAATLLPVVLAGCGSSAAGPAPTATAPAVSPSPRHISDTPVIEPSPTPFPTYAVPAGTPIPPQALALTVNGLPVYLSVYMAARDAELQRFWLHEHKDPLAAANRTQWTSTMRLLQEAFIQQEILLLYARNHHLEMTGAQLKEAIRVSGGQAAFNRALQQQHMTLAEYQDQIAEQNAVSQLISSVHPRGDKAHLRQIVVASLPLAQRLRTELSHGGDFAVLAQANSTDPTSRTQGGDMGFVYRGSVVPPQLEGPAFSLPINAISQPIQATDGYHLIQVLGRVTNVPLTGRQLAQARLSFFEQWYLGQRKIVHVQIFVKPG